MMSEDSTTENVHALGVMTRALPARDLLGQARSHERAGRTGEAIELYGATIDLARNAGERTVLAEALRHLGVVHHLRHEPAAARTLCQRSYVVAVGAHDDVLAAEALNALAGLDLENGAIEQARRIFRRALELGARSTELRARVEQNLGIVANVQGDLVEAIDHYRRSLEACRTAGNQKGCAIAYHNLGMISSDQERWDDADQYFRQSLTIAETIGEVRLRALCLLNHAEVDLARQHYEDACQNAERALGIFDQLGSHMDKSDAYKILGMVYRETGRPALAEGRLLTAVELAATTGGLLSEAEASRELARVYQELGRSQEALGRLNVSYRLFGRLDARLDIVDVAKKLAELDGVYREIALEWGADSYTGVHCDRVAGLAIKVARTLGLEESEQAAFRHSAYLSDVGKTRVPKEILNKPGPMTHEELALMRMHPVWGLELLEGVEFPWDIKPIIRSHHEKYDGSGYPDRLRGDEIPLGAQVICIADVFDALTTARSYRTAMTQERAVGEMTACRRWWRPDVFDAFMAAAVA